MINFSPLDRLRLERGITYLHALGPRVIAEFIAELAGGNAGEQQAILDHLNRWGELSPDMLRAAGGDRFAPSPIRWVL